MRFCVGQVAGGSAVFLVSGLRTHNQNRTVAARAIADMKTFGHLS